MPRRSSRRHTTHLALLGTLLVTGPARADDYYLSAPDLAAMEVALKSTGQWSNLGSDWNSDWNSDWGPAGDGAGFQFSGTCPSGSIWRLRVLGQLKTPAPSTALLPAEPGNQTSNVGKQLYPPFVTGTNQAVGVQSVPDTVSAFWVFLSWNCPDPLPNYVALGLTEQRANTAGKAGGPFAPHF